MHNVADYVKIVVIAFVAIYVINKVLVKVGAGQYATDASNGT